MENKVTFSNNYGTMALMEVPLSIFDKHIAGQIDENGNYYIICINHKTHEMYAVSDYFEWKQRIGRMLEEDENPHCFNGEWVRPMTSYEEHLWDEDRLVANIDCNGNVELYDTFDYDWYYESCI